MRGRDAGLAEGQLHRKLGAFARPAGDGHGTAVGLDHGLDDAQTQSRPSLRAGFVPPIEARPDAVVLFRRNADSRVAKADDSTALTRVLGVQLSADAVRWPHACT